MRQINQKCSAGNYPETLKAAYVINASTVFQLIFRVVQSSVQQKTLNKIKVFGSGNWEEVCWWRRADRN